MLDSVRSFLANVIGGFNSSNSNRASQYLPIPKQPIKNLSDACARGTIEQVTAYLKKNSLAQLTKTNEMGETALHIAACRVDRILDADNHLVPDGTTQIVCLLLSAGADRSALDGYGHTAFYRACERMDCLSAKMLSTPEIINHRDYSNYTPLHSLLVQKQYLAAKFLLENFEDSKIEYTAEGENALNAFARSIEHSAFDSNAEEEWQCFQTLCDRIKERDKEPDNHFVAREFVNHFDALGKRPLTQFLLKRKFREVKMLIDLGADFPTFNEDLWTKIVNRFPTKEQVDEAKVAKLQEIFQSLLSLGLSEKVESQIEESLITYAKLQKLFGLPPLIRKIALRKKPHFSHSVLER